MSNKLLLVIFEFYKNSRVSRLINQNSCLVKNISNKNTLPQFNLLLYLT